LELDDVRAFQVHLVSTGISWPALNQIVCALRFFYGITLGEALIPERIPYARQPLKLPVVLSADEVVQFLEAVSTGGPRNSLPSKSIGSEGSAQIVQFLHWALQWFILAPMEGQHPSRGHNAAISSDPKFPVHAARC
jgi:integrase